MIRKKSINMKQIFLPLVLFLAFLMFPACSGNKSPEKGPEAKAKETVARPAPVIGNETSQLLKELEESGDYVNSQQYPSLIKASLVNDAVAGKNLVIDLRSQADFASGHIKGAVNKKFGDLPGYFETGIKPFEYEKIILVCGDGQLSSYATSLLRLKGYGNVFAMRWGMSAWNRESANKKWLANLSGKYESSLDTVTHNKPDASGMPDPGTGSTTGKEISAARFAKLFSDGADNVFITADEVFKNPSAYYVINLERKDKYNDGHIPGAVRYKPDATLGVAEEMATIPYNKPVVLYCGTGHNSAFATAYLRLFGYDARTLRYGNNSFMHDRMVNRKAELSWIPFTEADVNNFPVVK
jgi:rhodanese-related sulfurtransferase